MKIGNYKRTSSNQQTYFVTVTEKEALSLIRSLSEQLIEKDPNVRRLETTTEDNEYFSIAVDFENNI